MSNIRHMDPYALDQRRQQLERDHEEVLQEIQRRAAEAPPAGIARATPAWTPGTASTLPRSPA